MIKTKREKRITRRNRIRSTISGTTEIPRLSVFKSNKNITAQLIDDTKGETLAYSWTKNKTEKTQKERAIAVGKEIAEIAKSKKISKVVFDRGGYIFTGNIKALADSARENGLVF